MKKDDKVIPDKQGITGKIDDFFNKYEKSFVLLSMVLSTLMCFLLFDVKVSLSGDDCDYIIAAGDFWKHFIYPGHHAPLYPIIISPVIGIFGVNLFLLKFLSAIFTVASLWLFYKSFQKIIPATVLIPALLLVSINPYVMFFASYTYTEPFFLLIQALFFYLFSRYFWKSTEEYTLKKDWKKYVLIALAIFCVGLTRTIGFSVIGVIIIYLLIERRWKDMIFITCAFAIIFGSFSLMKPIIWPNAAGVQSFEALFARNPYNTALGAEDIPGLMTRIVDNSHIYLSGFLYKYFGLRSSSDMPMKDLPILSLLSYTLFAVSLIVVFRKNKPLMFTGLYAGVLLFMSFLLLSKIWAQDRFIMVYYPYTLLFLIGGFYYIFTSTPLKKISFIYPLILASLLIGTSIHAKNRAGRNIPVLQQNILGNDLYGLTPDWENFIKMSRWADENLEKDAVIVSRKPSISYVYTGRDFYGLYNVPIVNINTIEKQIQEESDKSAFLVIEVNGPTTYESIRPFLQYLFISKDDGNFSINGKKISLAALFKFDKYFLTEELINYLDESNLNYTFEYESFVKQYSDDKELQYQINSPDELYNTLINSNIKYLILAQIRRYTPQNTGLYVNTVHQYINLVQYKYPNRFILKHKIGKEEICELAEFIRE
jgi:hypothetical protein